MMVLSPIGSGTAVAEFGGAIPGTEAAPHPEQGRVRTSFNPATGGFTWMVSLRYWN
jgi:hypothetical protein